jgi:hypothetical protein
VAARLVDGFHRLDGDSGFNSDYGFSSTEQQTREWLAPYCLYILALRERRIQAITAFVTPETFRRFGLSESIAR